MKLTDDLYKLTSSIYLAEYFSFVLVVKFDMTIYPAKKNKTVQTRLDVKINKPKTALTLIYESFNSCYVFIIKLMRQVRSI